MFIDVAGQQIYWFIPPLVAFIISFFTAAGGVSGAFLLLPFQVSVLGFTSPAVSATNQLYNVVGIPGGVLRYIKEGRMLWQLVLVIAIGTIPGVLIGTYTRIILLPDPTNFKVFVGFVLLYIGIKLIKDILRKQKNDLTTNTEKSFHNIVKNQDKVDNDKLPKIIVKTFNFQQLIYEFTGDKFTVSNPKVFSISFIIGIAAGAYGIGGGAIMSPILISLFNLPVYTIAGATLFSTFITSIFAVVFYQILGLFYPNMAIAPNWLLGIAFGIGGLAGIYLGARFQKYMPPKLIKWILFVCIIFIAFKYLILIF